MDIIYHRKQHLIKIICRDTKYAVYNSHFFFFITTRVSSNFLFLSKPISIFNCVCLQILICISTNLIGCFNIHFTMSNIGFSGLTSLSFLHFVGTTHSLPLIFHDCVPLKSFPVLLQIRQYIWLVPLLHY